MYQFYNTKINKTSDIKPDSLKSHNYSSNTNGKSLNTQENKFNKISAYNSNMNKPATSLNAKNTQKVTLTSKNNTKATPVVSKLSNTSNLKSKPDIKQYKSLNNSAIIIPSETRASFNEDAHIKNDYRRASVSTEEIKSGICKYDCLISEFAKVFGENLENSRKI